MRLALFAILAFQISCLMTCSSHRQFQKPLTSFATPELEFPEILAHPMELPFRLGDAKLSKKRRGEELPKLVSERIKALLSEYYFQDCEGDSLESYFQLKDCYVATFRMELKSHALFYVLLQHVPTSKLNGKVMVYDLHKKRLLGSIMDQNVHAMYDLQKGELLPSALWKSIDFPNAEIEVLPKLRAGIPRIQLNRLYHNGTANAIETTEIEIRKKELQAGPIKRKWIP